jgi:hypothetical protein
MAQALRSGTVCWLGEGLGQGWVMVRGRLALALRPGRIILWQLRLPWPVSSAELCVRRLISSARRGLRAVTPGSRLPSLRRTSGLAPVGRSSHGGDGVASPSPLASASEASSSASRSHSCWALSAEDVTSIEDMFKCVALDLVSVCNRLRINAVQSGFSFNQPFGT